MEGNADTTTHRYTTRIDRIAWLFAFVLPLILAALLLGVKSSQAAPSSPVVPIAFEDEEFELGDELEFEEAECEIAEEELEAGELGEAAVEAICAEVEAGSTATDAGPSSGAAGKCPLRSAHARAVVRHGRLKLTIGYTTNKSTGATIEVRSAKRRIASVHRKLGRSGVIRISRPVGKKRLKRVVVRFKAPSCGRFQTKPAKVS